MGQVLQNNVIANNISGAPHAVREGWDPGWSSLAWAGLAGGDGKVIITVNAAQEFYLGQPGGVSPSPSWLQPQPGDQ